jgi:tetratricopeptide (TPR) repeat protein
MRRTLPNTDPNDLANTLNYLGLILLSQDKLEEAEECHSEALAILQRRPTGNSERLISQLRANLGSVLGREGRFDDARNFINDALARQRAAGAESMDVAISTRALGVVLMQEGSLEESEATLLEALRLIRKNFPNDHPEVVSTYMSLAITLGSEFLNHPEKIRDAFVMFREAEAIRQRLKNPGARSAVRESAASVFEPQGSYAEAEVGLKTMRRFMQRSYPPGSWDDAYFLAMTGYVQLYMQKWSEAEATSRECYAIRAKLRPDDWSTFHAKNMIGAALAGQKKFAEAEPLLIEGYLGMKQQEAKIPAFHLVRLTEGLDRIIACYTAWGKPGEVAKWQAELKRVSQSKTAAN